MFTKNFARIAGCSLMLFTASSHAVVINADFVRNSGGGFSGIAVDATTGEVYENNTYFGDTTITKYSSTAAYEANTASSTLNTQNALYGNYMAANDGTLYGRSTSSTTSNGWPADAEVTAASGSTGSALSTTSISGMGGANGSETFNWGGFSGVAAMNDGSNIYVVGGDATTTDWRITTFDYGMNELNSLAVDLGGARGYGFAINGYVFFGDSYSSGQISKRVNMLTGLVEAVDFNLVISNVSLYLNNITYDAFSDTLYIHNLSNNEIHKVAGAADAFNAPSISQVPVPATLLLLSAGLIGLIGSSRKQKSVLA